METRKSIFGFVSYFCKDDRAPQYMVLSGMVTSSVSFSGLTTLRYSSSPRYQESRFSARRFQIPALSSETNIAVQAPGKTCGHVKDRKVKQYICGDYISILTISRTTKQNSHPGVHVMLWHLLQWQTISELYSKQHIMYSSQQIQKLYLGGHSDRTGKPGSSSNSLNQSFLH